MPDRGSTRHSARVDEQMDAEVASLTHGAPVEARAEEWRQMEPAAEGEPNPDGVTSVDEIEFRSLLATSLRPSAFPGDRAQLLEVARDENAEQRVLAWLESLPGEREFATVQSVWEALGGGSETREAPYPGTGPAIATQAIASREVEHPSEPPSAPVDTPVSTSPAVSATSGSASEYAQPAIAALPGRAIGIGIAAVRAAFDVAAAAVRVARRHLPS
jgi:hypothetical protein